MPAPAMPLGKAVAYCRSSLKDSEQIERASEATRRVADMNSMKIIQEFQCRGPRTEQGVIKAAAEYARMHKACLIACCGDRPSSSVGELDFTPEEEMVSEICDGKPVVLFASPEFADWTQKNIGD